MDKKCPLCNISFMGTTKYCLKKKTSKCLICNKTYTYICKPKYAKTCSKSCSSKLICQNNAKNKKVNCLRCEKEFKPKINNAKFCKEIKTSNCKLCNSEYTYICNDLKLNSWCSSSCRNKDMRKNNYHIQTKRKCEICSKTLEMNSSKQKICKNHIQSCLFCKEDFILKNKAKLKQKYCDNTCSTLAQMDSKIFKEKIKEYKNAEKWCKAFKETNKRKPNSFDFKLYFNIEYVGRLNPKLFTVHNGSSNLEEVAYFKIKNSINNKNITIIRNKRYKIKNKILEIDLYFPELNFGIEIQDLGTHSRINNNEQGKFNTLKKGPKYHKVKKDYYKTINIDVFEIWEDTFNKDINKAIKIINTIYENYNKK